MDITRICQKLVILWEKKKFLTLLEMEQNFLEETYFEILSRDLSGLRERLGELNKLEQKKRKLEDEQEIIELNTKINETEKYRNMIEQGKLKAKELKIQIKMFKSNLFK